MIVYYYCRAPTPAIIKQIPSDCEISMSCNIIVTTAEVEPVLAAILNSQISCIDDRRAIYKTDPIDQRPVPSMNGHARLDNISRNN